MMLQQQHVDEDGNILYPEDLTREQIMQLQAEAENYPDGMYYGEEDEEEMDGGEEMMDQMEGMDDYDQEDMMDDGEGQNQNDNMMR